MASYKVNIIHLLNPHMIWVEVKSEGEISFEQIGVYGILPLDLTLDPDGTFKTRRCEEWMPSTAELMKELFEDNEIYFYPIHIDQRTSIFDDNIHRYGELVVIKQSGKKVKVSKYLKKTKFALYDEALFLHELNSGRIKTKLSEEKTDRVIHQLLKKCRKTTKTQTRILHSVKSLQSSLTVKNIQLHNKGSSRGHIGTLEDLLERKYQDLKLCKQSDEESIGRAVVKRDLKKILATSAEKQRHDDFNRQRDISTSNGSIERETEKPLSMLLYRKLQLAKESQEMAVRQESDETFEATKVFFDSFNEKVKDKDRTTIDNTDYATTSLNHKIVPSKIIECEKVEKDRQGTGPPDFQEDSISNTTPVKPDRKVLNNSRKSPEPVTGVDDEVSSFGKAKKTSPAIQKIVHNSKKQTSVAYGPPEVDPMKLPIKIVSQEQFNAGSSLMEILEGPQEEVPEKRGDFDDVDSDIDLEMISPEEKDLTRQVRIENVNTTKDVKVHQKEGGISQVVNRIEINTRTNEADSKVFKVKRKENENNSETVYVIPPAKTNEGPETSLKCKELHTDQYSASKERSLPKSDASSKKSVISNNFLERKLQIYKNIVKSTNEEIPAKMCKEDSKPNDSKFSKEVLDTDDESDEEASEVIKEMNAKYPKTVLSPDKNDVPDTNLPDSNLPKNHVNPFKNVDPNISVFVDKLVTPVLMVHSKLNSRLEPSYELRDVNFSTHVHIVLKNMDVIGPMRLQTMSWYSILRGYSTFLIGPKGSGKTMGYMPAVCDLASDNTSGIPGTGPISIIVCATAISVAETENIAKLFLVGKEKVLACYAGMNELELATSLLNGCDLLIITPPLLVRLLLDDKVDLCRLTIFVFEDFERVSEVYTKELKFIYVKINKMLKNRLVKEVKVQYIVASRIWCDFMELLAKKAPDTVICIGAFQECVLYSKANTTATIVSKENKMNSVLEFMKQIDVTKKTVVVCRSDEEVAQILKTLLNEKYTVLACDTTMTVQDLHNMSLMWAGYQKSSGVILVCCDDNLSYMNVTNAHYLVHYSLPHLFSRFCKRFSVLNDNYASIFKEDNEDVKIKILLEEENTEQLPKILHFIKRCTDKVPESLDKICDAVLAKKEIAKAQKLVPICDNILAMGECPDFWNCNERHMLLKGYDEPRDWVPTSGYITFKIIHCHNAVLYSARLLTSVNNSKTEKYPQNSKTLFLKISMYFGPESNRKLHGVPEVGDICAVCIRRNFFLRCQVMKILTYYKNGKPHYVSVKLIDEERLERVRDIDLYYLPEEMRKPETYVVQIRLANIQPKDLDITFSYLAKQQLEEITKSDPDLYFRGHIALNIGNCILVDRLETYKDLSAMDQTIMKHDFRQELLDAHAIENPEHIPKLQKLCKESGLKIVQTTPVEVQVRQVKKMPEPQWAHLENDELLLVFFASALNPGTFFVRLVKFEHACSNLINDIEKYIETNPGTLKEVNKGDIVLAQFPDGTYERARIDEVVGDRVKCFFVDQGDWMEVPTQDLAPIPEKFITRLPFQAIECRMYGVKPIGDEWTEFSTNWLSNHFEDDKGDLKKLYVQNLCKEKSMYTGGNKYGVLILDTTTDRDLNINEMIVDVNLADPEDKEWVKIEEIIKDGFASKQITTQDEAKSSDDEDSWENVTTPSSTPEVVSPPKIPLDVLFPKQPLRSMTLATGYDSDTDEQWNINEIEDFMKLLKLPHKKITEVNSNLPAIKDVEPEKNLTEKEITVNKTNGLQIVEINDSKELNDKNSDCGSCEQKVASSSDFEMLPSTYTKLDSDDLTTPENTEISFNSSLNVTSNNELRKPKLCWRQNKTQVIIKILLIGIEKYNLEIDERNLKFESTVNETCYGFYLELYGVIDAKKSSHVNKGQYVLVRLTKVVTRAWMTLARIGVLKWIVYDVDSIDTSSDEEEKPDLTSKELIKSMCKEESETEDEDFVDDINYTYTR